MFPLLQLCDSLFPIGAFSHSDGLEAAAACGAVASASDLRAWMDVVLDEALAKCEAPAVHRARRLAGESRWHELAMLDEELNALRPAASGRDAGRAMGSRLVKTWRQIHPSTLLDDMAQQAGAQWTLPAAFGSVCAAASVDPRACVEGFVYTRLASTVSAAMRLIAIGQHEAHTVLAEALSRAPAVVEHAMASTDDLSMFAPAFDIAAMSHQYVHSRLFRS